MVTIDVDEITYTKLKELQKLNEGDYPTIKFVTKEVINQGVTNLTTPYIEHGDKTIKFAIHFLTDNIPEIPNADNRKIAHNRGVVFAFSNRSRDIGFTKPVHFNKLSELPKAIIQTIEKASVTIVEKNKNGKYETIELNEKLICGGKNEL